MFKVMFWFYGPGVGSFESKKYSSFSPLVFVCSRFSAPSTHIWTTPFILVQPLFAACF